MEVLQLLESSRLFFLIACGALGLVVGSFLNVVIYRLPVMMERSWNRECREHAGVSADTDEQQRFNLLTPASRCPQCDHRISALENIPLISYLFLKGRCSGCGTSISIRYPAVELATAILSVVTALHFGYSLQTVAALGFTWALIALFLIDFDHQILPDSITLPLLWTGLLLSLFNLFVDSHNSIVGAIAGYLVLWTIFHAFKLLTGKEGMGYGDFKLLGALGAWVGWQSLPVVILFSSVVGAAIGITLILFKGRDHSQPMPFGPFLAAAGWMTLLWGNDIISLYLQ
ncbi:MAG: A24 family peptidase [Gammaproteobacteria bacterium]|nr:A24 family peptidase [Gammaproteobacteria bacterium]MDH3984909.1 A24 family peptidase [Gammaproteobacteria bacterium]